MKDPVVLGTIIGLDGFGRFVGLGCTFSVSARAVRRLGSYRGYPSVRRHMLVYHPSDGQANQRL